MYLREMRSVQLLSREGEVAIAKRIEAGHEMVLNAIRESPLTFDAILGWRDALNEGKMLLRDIIDLDATYGGGFELVRGELEGLPKFRPRAFARSSQQTRRWSKGDSNHRSHVRPGMCFSTEAGPYQSTAASRRARSAPAQTARTSTTSGM
jgi:RNA polymerase primary sigma factor